MTSLDYPFCRYNFSVNQGMNQTWRLILSPAASGSYNMAVDEAILLAISQALAPPTLRLYAWDPACLSIGYAQPYEQIDQQAAARLGWDVVRRATGGRAILHTDELTYAIVGSDTHPILQGGILESYRRISLGLFDGLQRLGAQVSIHTQEPNIRLDRENPVCFQNPSAYEIKYQNRKLLGSAQVRRNQVVLQHGSLPLQGDIARICEGLAYPNSSTRNQAKKAVRQSATTLEQVVGRQVTWEQAAQALIIGFEKSLGIQFEERQLTPFEHEQIESAMRTKYGSAVWTKRL